MDNEVKISKRNITVSGQAVLIKLLQIGDDEGLTTQQAAELFGVTSQAIRTAVMDHNLSFVSIPDEIRKGLRDAGVIPFKGRVPNFLPKETLKELVRILNTPEAKAVYKQLWDIADHAIKGNYVAVGEAMGTSPADMLGYLEKAVTLIKEQQAEIAELRSGISQTPLKIVEDNALPTWKIALEFPKITELGQQLLASDAHFQKYGLNGCITIVLNKANVYGLKRRTKSGYAAMYNRQDLITIERGL